MGLTIINLRMPSAEDDDAFCARVRSAVRKGALLVGESQRLRVAQACRIIAEFNELSDDRWESVDAFPIDAGYVHADAMCMAINLAFTVASAIHVNVTDMAEMTASTKARGFPYLIALLRSTQGDSPAVWDIIKRYASDTDKQFRAQVLMVVEAHCDCVGMDAKWLRQLADELDATPPSSGSDADRPAADSDSPDRQG